MPWKKQCCNPFQKDDHGWSTKKMNLRRVTKWMCDKIPSISVGLMICDNCRKQLYKVPYPSTQLEYQVSDYDSTEPECDLPEPLELSSINQCLEEIGETPIVKEKLSQQKYPKHKLQKISASIKRTVFKDREVRYSDDESEIIGQLKDEFHSTNQRSKKMQILTVLPKSWTIQQIHTEFGATYYMARKAKHLVKESGILATPNPKLGHHIDHQTALQVFQFYESDEISRLMPGKKDFVSVKQGEQRVQEQKRLILSNLKELYRLFKDNFPTEKVGFSKFAELRPKHCVLAGASGTHSVCVCTIHQNVKLMINGTSLRGLSKDSEILLDTYHSCLAQIICNPALPRCYLGCCQYCPGISKLKNHLQILLEENMIDEIVYKQWVSVDRSTLESICNSSDDFVESFCEKLNLLLSHSFIATQQAVFYKDCKSCMKTGEVLVTVDFAENYAFVLQDAAQGFHWNNAQATVHPFVVYYTNSDKLCHLSYVVISDCMHHDTVAFHLFQKSFITFLMAKLPSSLKKVTYFSDGAAAQYKNRKNFINLCHHEIDFGIPAEWHFFATSHGKGACDGVGGTVKRLAAKASLQRPYDQQIMTPRQLYDWASENIKATFFGYCTTEEYETELVTLRQRFEQTRTIPGTRKMHSFIPQSTDTVETRQYSTSTEFKVQKVTAGDAVLSLDQIRGFVTCVYDQKWWLACVLETDTEDLEVKVSFLHPNGPAHSFRYPCIPDILRVTTSDVLTIVDPRTTTGRVYTITQKESKTASEKLQRIILT